VLKSCKSHKAPGEDGINMELFKFSDKLFKERLLNFMNKIWKGETPPQSWQKAVVIPIFKKGDMKECHNYQGISLLDAGYKIYSSIIKMKLQKLYESILGEEQNGF
jgi:hypothetical protein